MKNIAFITGTLKCVAHKNVNGQSVTLFILNNDDTLIKCKALGALSERAKEIFEKDKVITVVGSVTSKVVNGEISGTGIDVYHISNGEGLTPDGEEDVLLSDVINAVYNIEEDEAPKEWTPLITNFFSRAGKKTKAYLRGRWGTPKTVEGGRP